MILRNGRIYNEFTIDFDYALLKWRENKIYIGYGIYEYKKNI